MSTFKIYLIFVLTIANSLVLAQKVFPSPYLTDGILSKTEVLAFAYDPINEILYHGSREDSPVITTIKAGLKRVNAIDYSSLPDLPEVSKTGTMVAVYALAYKNDTLIIGGNFDTFGGLPRKGLAAYKVSTNTILSWNPSPTQAVKSLLIDGGYLYVGLQDSLYAAPFLPDSVRTTPFELKRYKMDGSFSVDSWTAINHLPHWGYTIDRAHWIKPSDSYQYKISSIGDNIYYLMNGFPLIINKTTGFTTAFYHHTEPRVPGDFFDDLHQAPLLPGNGCFLDFTIHKNQIYLTGDIHSHNIMFDDDTVSFVGNGISFDLTTKKLEKFSPNFVNANWCYFNQGFGFPSTINHVGDTIFHSGFMLPVTDLLRNGSGATAVRDGEEGSSDLIHINKCDSGNIIVATNHTIGRYVSHFRDYISGKTNSEYRANANALLYTYQDRFITASNNVIFYNTLGAPSVGTGTASVFCLPLNTTAPIISVSTTTICTNTTNVKYTVANNTKYIQYHWSYTGSGVTITGNGTPSLSIDFSNSATSGTLSVYGSNYCNDNTDVKELFIYVVPNPSITTSLISPANCFKYKDTITATSPDPVDFTWSKGLSVSGKPFQTLVIDTGIYKLTSINRIYGCSYYKDYRINSIAPNKILPSFTPSISCASSTVSYLASSLNPIDSISYRINGVLTSTINPAIFGTVGPHKLIINNPKFLSCADTTNIIIVSDKNIPNAKITSHSYVDPFTAVDTITCIKTIVNVSGASDTASTIINWRRISDNAIFSNPIHITTADNYKLIVKRTDNFCSDSSIIAFVTQSGVKPDVIINPTNTNINCSISTAKLDASTSYSSTTLLWTGTSYSSANPATVSNAGKYYITITRTDNGCSKMDSVIVNYTPTLLVKANNDTSICKNGSLILTANITGTLSDISYVWSNGSTGKTITVITPTTTNYIVSANSTSGCAGKDTVTVRIAKDMKDSLIISKNCNDVTAGSIVIFAKGGISPYYYSVNGSAYTTQNTYTNLPYGTFDIGIKDAIGCNTTTTATIDKNSSLPKPLFIASTQNSNSDTIVLVDLTHPKPDSVHWHLPNLARIVGGDNSNPLVLFADTGRYDITLDVFFTDCKISTTKNIHIAPFDTSQANATNKNGIKSIVLYPNPNNGEFYATIEFYKKQNASVQIWDAVSVKYFQENYLNTDFIQVPIYLSDIGNGTYIFKVVGEYQTKYVPFVITR